MKTSTKTDVQVTFKITRKPVEVVRCEWAPGGKKGCGGVLGRLTLSRLEEGLGHEGFLCGACGLRLKYVPPRKS